jgi:hypothetical protein
LLSFSIGPLWQIAQMPRVDGRRQRDVVEEAAAALLRLGVARRQVRRRPAVGEVGERVRGEERPGLLEVGDQRQLVLGRRAAAAV